MMSTLTGSRAYNKLPTIVKSAMALGSRSIGVKSSIVERAGLVNMLIEMNHNTIKTGNTHLKSTISEPIPLKKFLSVIKLP